MELPVTSGARRGCGTPEHRRLADEIATAHAELDQRARDKSGPVDDRTPQSGESHRRLIEELERTAAHLHRQGCGDGAAAVNEAVRRLSQQEEANG